MQIKLNKTGIYHIEDGAVVRFNPNHPLTWTICDNVVYFNAPCSMSYDEFIKSGGDNIELIFEI